MNILRRCKHTVLALILLAPLNAAWADWELDNTRSAINFVSIKNDNAAEVHRFGSLVGFIGDSGNVQLTVSLESVETQIEIRDDRMRETLFETATFPTAQITAQVDPAVIAAAAEGGVVTTSVPVTLSLHGIEKTLTTTVVAVGEGDGTLSVFTASPIIINAADFGLEAGVAALQKIAGLQSISHAVPVTLHLMFSPGK
jgi:polyisoprenoid-binding protein YceI